MSEQESTQEDSNDKVKDSIAFLIDLVKKCVSRGGIEFENVIKINKSIEIFYSSDSTPESQEDAVMTLIKCVHTAQNCGKLSLEEAFKAYKHITVFRV